MFISTATSPEVGKQAAKVAVLPVGSFEQHGSHLPLSTDTLIACAIACRVAADYDLMLLPPITISCSHEHALFPGTVSVSPSTLMAVVRDIAASLSAAGIPKLVIVNAHGGNYVLGNIAQEANVAHRLVALFPHSQDWSDARSAARLVTGNHEDMHAGEAETSILLAAAPNLVRAGYPDADCTVEDRRHLQVLGLAGYTQAGVIGRPSLATAEKGTALLDKLSALFEPHLKLLTS